jgi:hypothetical protein
LNAFESVHEIINHAIGIWMIDIEPVQFSIGRQIDPSFSLDIKNYAGSVQQRLFAGT